MENNTISDSGYFWWRNESIPEGFFAPESAVAGILTIKNDGTISLELHSVLSSDGDLIPFMFDPSAACQDIQGRLKSTSEHVLLTAVHNNGGRVAFGGISYEKYAAKNCLIGPQPFPSNKSEILYDTLSTPLTGFENWLCMSSIETTRTKRKLTSSYKNQKTINYVLSDKSNLSIEFEILGPYFGKSNNHKLNLTEQIQIKYSPNRKSTFKELKKNYSALSNLLLVLTGSDYSIEWPVLTIGKSKGHIRRYKAYFERSKSSAAPPECHNSWLTFPKVRESFGELFEQWQLKSDELGPGMNLYLGTRRGIELFEEHRFVNLVWGLESLHRTLNKDAPPTKLDAKLQRIIDQVKLTKDKRWLKEKLQHSTEPSLAERLLECVSTLNLNISEASIRAFSIECANKRNDISHFGGQRSPGGYGEFLQKICNLNDALTYIYPAILLKQCGLTDSIIKNIFTAGRMASRIKQTLGNVGLQINTIKNEEFSI